MTEQFKIGFIGLGIMGAPMVKNLINAKYEVYVYDIKQESIKNLVENGAIATKSSLDLGEKVDVVIIMVQDSANSEEAIISNNGVLNTLKKGTTIIDMSSISPLVSQKISKLCEQKGVDFLETTSATFFSVIVSIFTCYFSVFSTAAAHTPAPPHGPTPASTPTKWTSWSPRNA